jgi:hypothetical protein
VLGVRWRGWPVAVVAVSVAVTFAQLAQGLLTLRGSVRAACRFIPSPSAHPPGSGLSATGQGGAPHWTNDLDPWRSVCSARPGPMAMDEPDPSPSHHQA